MFGVSELSPQQFLDLLPIERIGEGFLAFQRGRDDFPFAILQGQDLFFNGIAGDQFVAGDHFGLPNAVGAAGGLVFHGRIPPRIEMDDRVGAGEVQAYAAGFQADEEHGDCGGVLEALNDRAAIGRGTVEVAELYALIVEPVFQQCQHAGELAENKYAMAAVDHFFQQFAEQVQLAGGVRGIDVFQF